MLTIRPAQIEDAPAMHELQQLAFAEEGRRSSKQDIPPLLEVVDSIARHIKDETALVALKDEKLVGCVRGVKSEKGYVVRALVVHPTCQSAGIGSKLLRALETQLVKPARVDLTTNTLMQGNVPFYEKHGYTVQNRTTPFSGIELAHMSKHLRSDA